MQWLRRYVARRRWYDGRDPIETLVHGPNRSQRFWEWLGRKIS